MLALVLSLAAAQGGELAREARVLAVLSEMGAEEGERGLGWYGRASFRRVSSSEEARVEAYFRVSCGNSYMGSIDRARSLELAARLCAAYGLSVQRELELELPDVSATLDVVDPDRRIALELSGPSAMDFSFATRVQEEEPARFLDEEERGRLRSEGWRLHCDELARHLNLDGEELGSRLAYLVGVVDFLNQVTDGEDVDLGGLLFERDATLQLEGAWRGNIGADRLLVLTSRGRPDFRPHAYGYSFSHAEASDWIGRLPGDSTRCAPSMLLVPLQRVEPDGSMSSGHVRLRFRQQIDGAEQVIDGSPGSSCLFLPSSCDLALPFTLEIEADEGPYSFQQACRVGAAASSARPRTGQREEEILELVRALEAGSLDEYAAAHFVEENGAVEGLDSSRAFRSTKDAPFPMAPYEGEVGSIALEVFERFDLARSEPGEWRSPWCFPDADLRFEIEEDGRPPNRRRAELLPAAALRWTISRASVTHGVGQRFPVLLAWVASLVELLNARTPGEDVELGGLLFEREARLEWPSPELIELAPECAATRTEDGAIRLVLRKPGVVRARFSGAALPEDARRDAPSVLTFDLRRLDSSRRPPEDLARPRSLLLRQVDEEGRELVHQRESSSLFLPPGFDLRRPFELELEFELMYGSSYRLGPHVRVGAAAR